MDTITVFLSDALNILPTMASQECVETVEDAILFTVYATLFARIVGEPEKEKTND